MRRTWMGIVFLLCGIALLSAGLRAQLPKEHKEAPGSLDGEVVNAKGAPVAGAQILWQAADGSGRPHVLHSDAQGQFRIASLRAGLYDCAPQPVTFRRTGPTTCWYGPARKRT